MTTSHAIILLFIVLALVTSTVTAKSALLGVGVGGGGGGGLPKDISFELNTDDKSATKVVGFGIGVDVNTLDIATSGGHLRFTPNSVEFNIGNTKWTSIITATDASYYSNEKLLFQLFNDGNAVSFNSAVSVNDLVLKLNGQNDILVNLCVADIITTVSPTLTPAMETKLRHDCEEKHRKSKLSLSMIQVLELVGKNVFQAAKGIDQSNILTSKASGGLNNLNRTLTATMDSVNSKISTWGSTVEQMMASVTEVRGKMTDNAAALAIYKDSVKSELQFFSEKLINVNSSAIEALDYLNTSMRTALDQHSMGMSQFMEKTMIDMNSNISMLNNTLSHWIESTPRLIHDTETALLSVLNTNVTRAINDVEEFVIAQVSNVSVAFIELLNQLDVNVSTLTTSIETIKNDFNVSIEDLTQDTILNIREYATAMDAVAMILNSSIQESSNSTNNHFLQINSSLEQLFNHSDRHSVALLSESQSRELLTANVTRWVSSFNNEFVNTTNHMNALEGELNQSIVRLDATINDQVNQLSQNISLVMARTNSILANAISDVNSSMIVKTSFLESGLANETVRVDSIVQELLVDISSNATKSETRWNALLNSSVSSLQDAIIESSKALRQSIHDTETLMLGHVNVSLIAIEEKLNQTTESLISSDDEIKAELASLHSNFSLHLIANNATIDSMNTSLNGRLNDINTIQNHLIDSLNTSSIAALSNVSSRLMALNTTYHAGMNEIHFNVSALSHELNTTIHKKDSDIKTMLLALNASVVENRDVAMHQLNQAVSNFTQLLANQAHNTSLAIQDVNQHIQQLNASTTNDRLLLNESLRAVVTASQQNSSAMIQQLRNDTWTRLLVMDGLQASQWNLTNESLLGNKALLLATEQKLLQLLDANNITTEQKLMHAREHTNQVNASSVASALATQASIFKLQDVTWKNITQLHDTLSLEMQSVQSNVSLTQTKLTDLISGHVKNLTAVSHLMNTTLLQLQNASHQSLLNQVTSLMLNTSTELSSLRSSLVNETFERIALKIDVGHNLSTMQSKLLDQVVVVAQNVSSLNMSLRTLSQDLISLGSNISMNLNSMLSNTTSTIALVQAGLLANISTSSQSLRHELKNHSDVIVKELVQLTDQHNKNVTDMNRRLSNEIEVVNTTMNQLLGSVANQYSHALKSLEGLHMISSFNHSNVVLNVQTLAKAIEILNQTDRSLELKWNQSITNMFAEQYSLSTSLQGTVKESLANFSLINGVKMDAIQDEYKFLRGLHENQSLQLQELRIQGNNTSNALAHSVNRLHSIEEYLSFLRNSSFAVTGNIQDLVLNLAATSATTLSHGTNIISLSSQLKSTQETTNNNTLVLKQLLHDQVTTNDLIHLFANLTKQATDRSDILVMNTREELAHAVTSLQQQQIEQTRLATRVDGILLETLEGHTKSIQRQKDEITSLQIIDSAATVKFEHLQKSLERSDNQSERMQLDLQATSSKVQALQAREQLASDKITTLENKIAFLEQSVSSQALKLTEMNTIVDSQATKISKLELELDGFRRSTASVNELNDLRKLVLDLQTTLVGHTGKVLEVVTAAYNKPAN